MGCTITNKIYTNDYGYAFVRKASSDITTISAISTPTLISGTFFEKANIGSLFTTSSSRITNTSGKTITVKCTLNCTDQQTTGGSVANLYIAKNGAVDNEQYQELRVSGNKGNTALFAIFTLAPNDYVEPYISHTVLQDIRTITTQFLVEAI